MSVISTIKTDCKDCYKCIRSCPMKAIRVTDGRAQIVEERCINDGNCINVCPQGAKQVRQTDSILVREWIKAGETMAVSLAPSYPVAFESVESCEIIPILRKMGFTFIQETAWAAEYVAREHLALLQNGAEWPVITSSCPVIVDLVEKHYPELIPYLAPVLSPMALHGKVLKERFKRVIFVGPCIAKKEEMEQAGVRGAIDAVLTFKELQELAEECMLGILTPGEQRRKNTPVSECQQTAPHGETQNTFENMEREEAVNSFDGEKAGLARLFPLGGGLLKTVALSTDSLADEFLTVTGLEEVIEFLNDFSQSKGLQMIEMLACKGGCINGVGSATKKTLIERRQQMLKVPTDQEVQPDDALQPNDCRNALTPLNVSVVREYASRMKSYKMPSDDEIREILATVGKTTPEDELNCGSCGYNSCREKAIAVHNGLAELEMCLPYMRSRAESMSNLIIRTTPNGLIVVDKQLKIVEVNPSAERMFQISNQSARGMDLAKLMDVSIFQQVAEEKRLITDLCKYSNSLIVRQYVFYVDKHDLVIGIFYDVTNEELQKHRLDTMREETLLKAQEVIDKQMRVAQEIAGLLGETTAETKVTLTKLMNLMEKK